MRWFSDDSNAVSWWLLVGFCWVLDFSNFVWGLVGCLLVGWRQPTGGSSPLVAALLLPPSSATEQSRDQLSGAEPQCFDVGPMELYREESRNPDTRNAEFLWISGKVVKTASLVPALWCRAYIYAQLGRWIRKISNNWNFWILFKLLENGGSI